MRKAVAVYTIIVVAIIVFWFAAAKPRLDEENAARKVYNMAILRGEDPRKAEAQFHEAVKQMRAAGVE